MEYKLTILVNTTDSFEDCWFPFFTLFKKYWPEFKGKIYLNTETKIYCHDGLNIICIQNNMEKPNNTLKWGECLIRALNFIDDNVILYMQEDYFLKDFVKNDYLDEFVKLISTNIDIDCIHLTDAGGHLGISSSYHDKLNHLISPQRYLANCQAALWKKKTLISLLRPFENAWQFEEFGSKRAARSNYVFLGVSHSLVKHDKFEIIPYVFTGIIQGRWFEPVVELFQKNNLFIDFSKRGFVNQTPKRSLINKLLFHLKRWPILFKNWMELFFLK